MTKINFEGKEITIESENVGTATPWGKGYIKQHHRVKVTVDSEVIEFDYYYLEETLDEGGLVYAFYCFLDDGTCYANNQDIDDFFNEFGYNKVTDCINAYNGCKKAYEDWQKTGIDIFEIANYLQETYNL